MGCAVGEADEAAIESLIRQGAKEGPQLDFKRDHYESNDRGKLSLAVDVAAFANALGGDIVIGIAESSGAASELSPQSLTDADRLRMTSILSERCRPVPDFRCYGIPAAAGGGYWIIHVSPSGHAPHAVLEGMRLRYPRRIENRNRDLSESEVADAYRNRFRQARQDVDDLEMVMQRAMPRLSDDVGFLALGVVPLRRGWAPISQRALDEAVHRASFRWCEPVVGGAVFSRRPTGGTDIERLILSTGNEAGSGNGHAELYLDGRFFAATVVARAVGAGPLKTSDEHLVNAALSLLRVARSEMLAAAANGEAIARIGLLNRARREWSLNYSRGDEWELPPRPGAGFGAAQFVVDEVAGVGLTRLAAQLLSPVFQSLGSPELYLLTEDGRVRRRYIRERHWHSWREFAESEDVGITNEEI